MSFLEYFIKQCTKVNIEESDKQESDRYERPPWNNRIVKWLYFLEKARTKYRRGRPNK